MDTQKQADQVLDRAIDAARHIRRGETDAALQSIIALRGSCDWIGRELWQKSLAEYRSSLEQTEECSSLLQTLPGEVCHPGLQTKRQTVLRLEAGCNIVLRPERDTVSQTGCQTVLQPELRETVSQTNAESLAEYRSSLEQTIPKACRDISPLEKARHDLAAILARKAVRA